ncbi:hypothetical protein OAQ96_02485 [Alphaproteobacteria bacterium]|nr:hypothetical protein [Alphaproteobacteria bacterium]
MFIRNIFIIVFFIISSNPAFSKDGYKDIKFDMTIEEVLDLAKSNNASSYQEEKYSSQIITIEGLYKYDLKVWFYEESEPPVVDAIQVIVFDENYRDKYFVINNSGIDKFEDLRKNLNKKYKLLVEPDDLSIDKYNNDAMGDQIVFSYLSDGEPKIIIDLSLQTYNHVKYIASVWYSNPKHTENFIKYNDNSSDDF